MPKINKIRIINFSYNNDTREIPDETFRFYNGENALLNLANGGGKTVLIQLFMQPILPDLKIQKRRMIDYFRRNSTPAYVMIEWLLDNPSVKDYLMTGIAIAPGNSLNMEDSNRIHYFTFASHYQRACEFDLQMVPFSRKEGEKQILLPFERARESVKKLVGSHREMFYFGREDVGEYRKLLGRFGISQEEWRNIIARMNNDEGGITELFDKCSTSDSVLNEWVIKNIEKSQLAGRTEDTCIQELFGGLVADTLKNEEYIQAQKVIREYMEEHRALERGLEELCSALDGRLLVQKRMNAMHRALGIQAGNARMDGEELAFRLEEIQTERRHIDWEETSENYGKMLEELCEASTRTLEMKEEEERLQELLNLRSREKECQEGAQVLGEIRRLQGKIQALKESMEQEQGDERLKNRMKDLAYSLKLQSRRQYESLSESAEKLQRELEELQQQSRDRKKEAELDRQKWGELKSKEGALRSRVRQFEEEQKRVFARLGFALSRNLLEQLDITETEKYRKLLESQVRDGEQKVLRCQTQTAQTAQQQKEISQKLKEQGSRSENTGRELEQAKEARQHFLEERTKCEAVLEKYGVEREHLYDPERLQAVFGEKMSAQKAWIYQAKSEQRQVEELILGIRNHCVYLPETVLAAVDGQDISYQTGEEYLQNLPEENRSRQLLKNPLLPFGLILEKRDMDKLDDISFGECYLRQIVPVFTYEQLEYEYLQDHGRVRLPKQAELIAAYQEQIFSDAQREDYLGRLEVQRAELEKLIQHREEEEQQLYEAKLTLESFPYKKGAGEELENQVRSLEEQQRQLIQELETMQRALEQLEQEQIRLGELLPKLQEAFREALAKEECYRNFLEADVQYQKDFHGYGEVRNQREALDRRIREEEQLLEKTREEEKRLLERRIQTDNACQSAKETAAKYAGAEKARVLEEDFNQMEQELQTLRAERERTYASWQSDMEDAERELSRQKEKQEELDIPQEEYASLKYDPAQVRALKKEIRELEGKADQAKERYQEAIIREAKAETNKEHGERRLSELGLDGPLDSGEIRRDYERRRKNLNFEWEKLNEKAAELRRTRAKCENLQNRIRDVVPQEMPGDVKVKLEEDIEKQFQNLKEEYHRAKKDAERRKNSCKEKYQETKDKYKGKNQCVEEIISSLSTLPLDDPDLTYDKVYFYLEEFMMKRESLEKLLDYYSIQLEAISRTKNQIIDQCVSYGMGIYDEIKTIALKSKIRLSQKSRAVQMLKIDVPANLDNRVRERMEEHINKSLQIMVTLNKKEESDIEKKIREKLAVLTSGRELLNQVIGTNKIPVSVYKIDLNEKNSGLKRWEDAMAQNSGGEKFVVFFTLVSTLISYIREVTRIKSGGDPIQESKVLIMDNPFARTSSEHLLKAVMDIADTFRIQLICLSDLNQSSITNRFSLFYQLSVRKRMYSDKEVLKAGEVQMNQPGLSDNERLEHMELYETGRQENLWELMGDL